MLSGQAATLPSTGLDAWRQPCWVKWGSTARRLNCSLRIRHVMTCECGLQPGCGQTYSLAPPFTVGRIECLVRRKLCGRVAALAGIDDRQLYGSPVLTIAANLKGPPESTTPGKAGGLKMLAPQRGRDGCFRSLHIHPRMHNNLRRSLHPLLFGHL